MRRTNHLLFRRVLKIIKLVLEIILVFIEIISKFF
ncbi:hypothetical protein BDW_05855 [Bdellovibrio bacteriovorus W]|nr:hypothetical protein BDW_05855 [Bdellovibrio bacteriovorus W]